MHSGWQVVSGVANSFRVRLRGSPISGSVFIGSRTKLSSISWVSSTLIRSIRATIALAFLRILLSSLFIKIFHGLDMDLSISVMNAKSKHF